jgi:hypothetical protein
MKKLVSAFFLCALQLMLQTSALYKSKSDREDVEGFKASRADHYRTIGINAALENRFVDALAFLRAALRNNPKDV